MSQSSYQTNDGLSSEPAQLVVRHPPSEPRIYTDGRTFATEKQLSVLSDREQVIIIIGGLKEIMRFKSHELMILNYHYKGIFN